MFKTADTFPYLLASGLLFFVTTIQAMEPMEGKGDTMVAGTVEAYLLTHFGDIEGLLPDDGTQILLPVHMQSVLRKGVTPGDTISTHGYSVKKQSRHSWSIRHEYTNRLVNDTKDTDHGHPAGG